MPTYIVRAPNGRLSPEQKAGVVTVIAETHAGVTGVAMPMPQVIFQPFETGDVFLCGKPLGGDMLFVQGHIQAGRGVTERSELIKRLVPKVAALLAMPRHAVWVYLTETPSRAMAEYGHIVAEPGREEQWLAALSSDERAWVAGG